MRLCICTVSLILLLVASGMAAEPELRVYTDKGVYDTWDSGKIFIELETHGVISQGIIEAEILGPKNKFVYGAILKTNIPEEIVLNPETKQTEQILLQETFNYLKPEKIIVRTIDFVIPDGVPTGEYRVNVRFVSPNLVLKDSAIIDILGKGEFDLFFILYIAIVIFSIYLIRGG